MGILLKHGITLHLIESVVLALVAIDFLMAILNSFPEIKNIIPNRTLQLGGTFGKTEYFGIPISIALLLKD